MRKAPSPCVHVSVRLSETLRPGETRDQAVERLLPRAIEELRARASDCGLLPPDAEVEHHIEIETRCSEGDEPEVEVRVALFDRSRTSRVARASRTSASRPNASGTNAFQRRTRLGA